MELGTPKNLIHQITFQIQVSSCFSWIGGSGESSFSRGVRAKGEGHVLVCNRHQVEGEPKGEGDSRGGGTRL